MTAWPRVISTANWPPCPLAACSGIALLASSVATLANLDRRTRIAQQRRLLRRRPGRPGSDDLPAASPGALTSFRLQRLTTLVCRSIADRRSIIAVCPVTVPCGLSRPSCRRVPR